MIFGTASFGVPLEQAVRQAEACAPVEPPRRKHGGGRPAQRYDCGRYGQLTIAQIAKVAGLTREGVQARINRKVVGADLCRNLATARRIGYRRRTCSRPVLLTAVRLAQAYPHGTPTVADIRIVNPMSATAAGRWRQAIRDIREELGLPP